MANCRKCKRLITKNDKKKAHEVYNEESGRLEAILHNKCWYIEEKLKAPQRMVNEGRITANTPTVYGGVRQNRDDLEQEALRKRQVEIAEERKKETVPTTEEDWREPVTLDLEELVEEVGDNRTVD